MKVFHGTNIVIEHPKITNRFKTLDFGMVFTQLKLKVKQEILL